MRVTEAIECNMMCSAGKRSGGSGKGRQELAGADTECLLAGAPVIRRARRTSIRGTRNGLAMKHALRANRNI